ncbi:PAS domain S-box-containing protein [Humidesulfovibrio mexicanus]|uniref:histidine kinase n=1 Tax=Humidesulfovibrio mexicanus TaxID=147047 RepID=A0A238YYZ8_9BACT|nr:ATP-binding protein [Humidesulfovibrio mexicanus]SNR76345.1 PAS domain S-box-containing protein [Humidesulfovibrio mexicanus]
MRLWQTAMFRYGRLSLKNKIFVSILGVVLLISVAIAFLARYILVSSLTTELEMRGSAIAHSIAERGSGYVLDKNTPLLLSLIFDEARLHERKKLISYIFVTDQNDEVLAHTMTRAFPQELRQANALPPTESRSVRLVSVDQEDIHDIAVPIREGLYRIGTVHVGLSKSHIDSLIATLRLTFLGFISAIILIIFFLSNRITQYITHPLSKLTRIADELSRGNFDITMDLQEEDEHWKPMDCPAYENTEMPCWHFDQSARSAAAHRTCKNCVFYRKRDGDEVAQMGDSFRNMVWSIKLYRRRLRESEEKYRSLFDSGPDPVFVVDCEDFRIADANPRALELYGYDKEELIGMSYLALGPENRKDCLLSYEGGETDDPAGGSGCLYHPKVLHYKKGMRPFYVNVHACPISYRGRHAIIISVADITEMIEKDAQLIQAGKMKSLGEMSAGIAHELNQPLNAIKMGSEFLAILDESGQTAPPEAFRQVVREISGQVDRAAEIINTLRSFGRKAEMLKEPVDVNAPIKSVLTIVRRQFELDNIRFHLELAEGLPKVLAHDNRLQQVFFNLLTNARDAINEASSPSDEGARRSITIATRTEGQSVVVEVRDTGIGMAEDMRDKIFEPFFTTKETGQGMGLGLAITYGIVRDYGGQIRIDSAPGKGAAINLHFPQAE